MKISITIILLILNVKLIVDGRKVVQVVEELDSLLVDAYVTNNQQIIDVVQGALDTVHFAAGKLSSADEKMLAVYKETIDNVIADVPSIKQMVRSPVRSRNLIRKMLKFVATLIRECVNIVKNTLKELNKGKLGGLTAVFSPFIEQLKANEQIKSIMGGFRYVEQGVKSLNMMTGGTLEPLITLGDILSNIDAAGDFISTMSSRNSSTNLDAALIDALRNSKSINIQKFNKSIDYICNEVNDQEAAYDERMAAITAAPIAKNMQNGILFDDDDLMIYDINDVRSYFVEE